MTVYVDNVRHSFGNMVMCHMWSESLNELLAMADKIGVQRKWIQGHPELSFGKHKNASWVHFDIALSKKALAIRHGAEVTDKYGPVEHLARLDLKDPDPKVRDRARTRLNTIASMRDEGRGDKPGAQLITDGNQGKLF